MPSRTLLFAATGIVILLLQSVSLISADTPLPATRSGAVEAREVALIRGLLATDLTKRQTSSDCPAPQYPCQSFYCCLDKSYSCCGDGSCCWPNTYCFLGSNGIMGCCEVGKVCSGPAPDHTTLYIDTYVYSHSTSTGTSSNTIYTTTTYPATTPTYPPSSPPSSPTYSPGAPTYSPDSPTYSPSSPTYLQVTTSSPSLPSPDRPSSTSSKFNFTATTFPPEPFGSMDSIPTSAKFTSNSIGTTENSKTAVFATLLFLYTVTQL